MKKIWTTFCILCLFLLLSTRGWNNSGGPQNGYSGAPNESNCTSCHAGNPSTNSNLVSLTATNAQQQTVTSLTPGQTYSMTLTLNTPANRYGFELTNRRGSTNSSAGTFIAGVGSQISTSGSVSYIKHNSSGIISPGTGSKSWTFSFTAPAAGFGSLTFYAATMAADGSFGTSGDLVYLKSFAFSEAISAPTITLNAPGAGPYCPGTTLNLPFTVSAAFNAGNSFLAELSDANGSFTNPQTIGSLQATGSGTIQASIPSSIASGSAYAIRIKATNPSATSNVASGISISAAPAVPTIQANGSTTLCPGDTVQLSVPNVAGITYSWFMGGQPLGASGRQFTIGFIGSYSVTATNAAGCSSQSAPIQINAGLLAQSPTITVNGNASFCQGDSVQLQIAAQSGISSYQWFLNGAPLSVNGTTCWAKAAGNYTVLAGLGNCATSSLPVNINVISGPPTPVITAASGTPAFCQGDSVQLQINTPPGGTSLQWYLNGQPLIFSGTAYWAKIAGNYTVKATAGNCSSLSAPLTVSVNPKPLPPVISTPNGTTAFCQGDSLQLTTQNQQGATYNWFFSRNPIAANGNSLYAKLPGVYSVRVNLGTCSDTATPVFITQNPSPPKPTITRNGNVLISSANSGNQWFNTAFGAISGQNAQNFTPSTAGLYYVQVQALGCKSPNSDTVNFIGTGTADLNNRVRIYPNPSQGNITLSSAAEPILSWQIVDLQGKTVRQSVQTAEIPTAVQIQTEDLPKSVYFIRIQTASFMAVEKVVLQ